MLRNRRLAKLLRRRYLYGLAIWDSSYLNNNLFLRSFIKLILKCNGFKQNLINQWKKWAL